MPELPEIETIRLQLEQVLPGQVIAKIEQLHKKSVQGDVILVEGKKVTGVRRFGKMLVIDLSNELHLAIHFKMSGQLIFQPKADRSLDEVRSTQSKVHSRIVGGPARDAMQRIAGGHPTEDWVKPLPSKHTRATLHFKSGDTMHFNDQRMFGWVKIVSSKQLAADSFVKNLGPEPWDVTDKQFYELVRKRKKAIKLVLMDQTILSGVGNIYANDALWEARIHPSTPAQSLSVEKAKLLRTGLIKVLKEGIKYGGATAADAKYIDLDGLGGHYQDHFRTYDRTGEKCLRNDAGTIKKTVLGGRGTYFCSVCQRET